MAKTKSDLAPLAKAPTGISGFDDISFGGLPAGRPTLITGGAGSGKTMFAMEFLVRGATQFGEPGVFMAFEETGEDLEANFASRGYDLKKLQDDKKLAIEHVYVERSEIEETGEYDLEGLFIRLAHAVNTVGAKRVVLDTIEVLFSGLSNTAILRAELRRLFRWIKDHGLTAIVTGERGGPDMLTRYGLEEYVADCVIVLDHRVNEQISTRRLRIMKYRGSPHATNEFPFLIEDTGITVLPITSLALEHKASTERIPTGIPGLDEMLGGEGFYRGTSVIVTGTAGTGKTSIAASFAAAAANRGEKCLYFAFEESPSQLIRNMRSIGIELESVVKKGLLTFHATRPTQYGLETHLARMIKHIGDVKPSVVVIDPISNLISTGETNEVRAMLTRLVDYLKSHGITAVFTSLTGGEEYSEDNQFGVSSLMDSWISLRNLEINGERNRGLYVLKSRGMSHSSLVREFVLTDKGIKLIDVYVGPEGILAGTAREIQQAQDRAEETARRQKAESRLREVERKRELLEARIAAMWAEFEVEESEATKTAAELEARESAMRESVTSSMEERSPVQLDDKKARRRGTK